VRLAGTLPRFVGTIGPDVRGRLKVLKRAGEPAQVSVVYVAGPTGYELYHELGRRRGYRCEIIVPSHRGPCRVPDPAATKGTHDRAHG
jgi:hypothetical protein